MEIPAFFLDITIVECARRGAESGQSARNLLQISVLDKVRNERDSIFRALLQIALALG
jgi:hypothetical protein